MLVNNSDLQKCYFCNKKATLQKSHLIPKFIGKWLKETSATGYLRHISSPNKRVQDLITYKLLCKDCESLFQKWEDEFAKKIFYPYISLQKKNFEFQYDNWLLKFIISVNWRILTVDMLSNEIPIDRKEILQNALTEWHSYLQGKISKTKYQHHLFFMDMINEIPLSQNNPIKINNYLNRSVDQTIVYNEGDRLFQYTKFPFFILTSFIKPKNPIGWKSTLIKKKGTLKNPQSIKDQAFGQFILSRAKLVGEKFVVSKKQEEIIENDYLKDIEKTANSESFRAHINDSLIQKIFDS